MRTPDATTPTERSRIPHAGRYRVLAIVCMLAAAAILGACGTTDLSLATVEAEEPSNPTITLEPEEPSSPRTTTSLSLHGDPDFTRSQLTAQQRTHYDRLWHEINDPDNHQYLMQLAASDDAFTYARDLHGYIQVILTAFRITGDLALLDHVDTIAQRMRQELRDEWRGTTDGTDGTTDGYLNWVYRQDPRDTYRMGKDTGKLDEMRLHSIIAMIAYTLDLNRDLDSPNGHDYAAHADFWHDYLINHFEAKWRERTGKETGFPFLTHPGTSVYYAWTLYHYFMGRLTHDDAYLTEATRMADTLWDEIRTTTTPTGTAYVWAGNITSLSSSRNYLQATGYASGVYGSSITFHLEGFHNWASEEHLHAFARTFTEFIASPDDTDGKTFASDIGGGTTRAGLPSDDSWPRRTESWFTSRSYALISAWDTTNQIANLTQQIQDNHPNHDTTHLTTALLLHASLHPTTSAPGTTTTGCLRCSKGSD